MIQRELLNPGNCLQLMSGKSSNNPNDQFSSGASENTFILGLPDTFILGQFYTSALCSHKVIS